MRLTLALTLGAMAAGCSLVYWPPDADFTGAAPTDAAALGEASAEGSAPVRDGAADAPADAGLCPPQAILCDDFERARVLGDFDQATGTVSITSKRAHSPTRSLSALAKNGADAPALSVQKTLPPRVTFSFWFYIPTSPPSGDLNFRIANILWGTACDWDLTWELFVTTGGGLQMNASVYDVAMNASCGPVTSSPRTLLLPSEVFLPSWHHLIVSVDVSAQQRRIDATIDGTPAPRLTIDSTRNVVPKAAQIAVGIPCINANSGCFPWTGADYEVLIDDVTLAPLP